MPPLDSISPREAEWASHPELAPERTSCAGFEPQYRDYTGESVPQQHSGIPIDSKEPDVILESMGIPE
jgi:hypothetical protein